MHPYRFNVHSFSTVAAAKAMLLILARMFKLPRKAMRIETHEHEQKTVSDEVKISRYSTLVLDPVKVAPQILQSHAFGCNVFDSDACGDHLTRTLSAFVRGFELARNQGKRGGDGIEVTTIRHKPHDSGAVENVMPIRATG